MRYDVILDNNRANQMTIRAPLYLSFLTFCLAIQVQFVKRNVFIPQNSCYLASIELQRQNAELIPTTVSLQTSVANTIPKFGDCFDYFYFLTLKDIECYQQAVQNQSYLFPCPFLTNHYSQNRISQIESGEITQSIADINDVRFSFIIDNTQFPTPKGAYSYSSINLDITTKLNILVSSSYEILGRRMIFINGTIFLIFLVITVTIVVRTDRITKKMDSSKNNSMREERTFIEVDEDDSLASEEEEEQEEEENKDEGLREAVLSRDERMSRESSLRIKAQIQRIQK